MHQSVLLGAGSILESIILCILRASLLTISSMKLDGMHHERFYHEKQLSLMLLRIDNTRKEKKGTGRKCILSSVRIGNEQREEGGVIHKYVFDLICSNLRQDKYFLSTPLTYITVEQ